jgi:hypothetical protein
MFKTKISVAVTAALLLSGGTASAAVTITGWDLGNVSSSSASGEGTSTIYDSAVSTSGAHTSGFITYDGLTGFSPGVKIVNDDPLAGSSGFNCIMANATGTTCNDEMKTHKRFKLRATDTGPIDMVFNVNPNGSFSNTNNDGRYKVFQAFGNDTGARMDSFRVTLGTGVGTNFVSSTANDGLSVVQSFVDDKPLNNSQFSALFSNGLFGPQEDPQHPLIGYFSNDRTGFSLEFDGTDSFYSTGMFGDYESLFGSMLSYDQLPLGYFFDDDGDANTDDVLIAHQLANGTWSQNRSIIDGEIGFIAFGHNGDSYSSLEDLVTALTGTGIQQCAEALEGAACLAGTTEIDDLAKFNLSFYIDPTGYTGDQFTMRYEVAAVPEAETWAMLLAGLGLVGFAVRRRRI